MYAAAAPQPSIDSQHVQGEIRHLLQQGSKIGAIKRYREVYGVGLKEAKEAVEAIDVGGWSPPSLPPTFSGYGMENQQEPL